MRGHISNRLLAILMIQEMELHINTETTLISETALPTPLTVLYVPRRHGTLYPYPNSPPNTHNVSV
jgi:hypothetical protein